MRAKFTVDHRLNKCNATVPNGWRAFAYTSRDLREDGKCLKLADFSHSKHLRKKPKIANIVCSVLVDEWSSGRHREHGINCSRTPSTSGTHEELRRKIEHFMMSGCDKRFSAVPTSRILTEVTSALLLSTSQKLTTFASAKFGIYHYTCTPKRKITCVHSQTCIQTAFVKAHAWSLACKVVPSDLVTVIACQSKEIQLLYYNMKSLWCFVLINNACRLYSSKRKSCQSQLLVH